MPIRDVLVLGTVLASLPVCFLRPWIGVLVFAWISYMNPHRYAWGFARDFQVAMVVAVATLLGLLFTRDRSQPPRDLGTVLLAALWVLFTLTTPFAINPEAAWPQWEKVSKIWLMTFVTLMLINSAERLRYLLLVMALSVGLLGLKGGLFALATGGQWRVYGPPGSFLANNGDFALGMNMTLPLLLYLAKDEPRRWLRILLRVCFGFGVIAVIFTYSRGGFLGLLAVAALLLLHARRKAVAAVLLTGAALVIAAHLPERWQARMETIQTYEEDASAQGRINAWWTAWNLALDRPFTGGGFETFTPHVFARYAPLPDEVHDAHSIYFEMLGEHGFIALALYLLLIGRTLLTLQALKRRARRDPAVWWRHYPDMLQISVAAYLVGGAFLGRAYFDFFYHVVAATIILRSLVERAAAPAPAARPRPVGVAASPGFALAGAPLRMRSDR